MDVRLPDGTVVQGVPDGTTKADLAAKLKANGMAVPADWLAAAPATPQPSTSEQIGTALRDVPRQLGLTARYAAEGLPGMVDMLATPFRVAQEKITGRPVPTAGGEGGMASRLADWIGLPKPQTANERVIGDATRTGFSVIGGGRGAQAMAPAAAEGGVARNVLEQMAERPGVQAVSGAVAGGANGAVREAGGGPAEQFLAALAGGVAGGVGAAKVADGTNAVVRALTPRTVQVRQADQAIELALQRSGVDWGQVPERVRQGVRQEVADAMGQGRELNADALRRLLAFRSTGTTPTVGMLTQDPGQITREMNLAKTGANSTDSSLQRLPSLQNDNARQLLRNVDDLGASTAYDPHADFASRATGALEQRAGAARDNINRLYAAARDTEGRSLPLDGHTFTRQANAALDDAMVGGSLPGDVAAKLNAIAKGELPLTVEIAEQLKTRLGALQRGASDGSVRTALGIVRKALDDAPLQTSPKVNPGNLPAVLGTVPPSASTIGQESIDAFNAARTANRQYMQQLEANPALAAVDDAAHAVRDNPALRSVPDVVGANFGARFLTGKSATPGQVAALAEQVGPEATRAYVLRYLRDAATSATQDITKFSESAYRRALRDIGDAKLLAAGFGPDEVLQLRNVGEAAKLMQAQPVGSAVNNSNSGALVLGRGLDWLDRAVSNLPVGGDMLRGRIQGAMQTQVLSPRNALALALDPAGGGGPRVNPLLALAVSPAAQARDDDRGKQTAKDARVHPRGR